MDFKNITVFMTGGSRGIGLAIAIRLAKEGANVAIAAKTVTPHPKLEGTIYTAVDEINQAGGTGLPIHCDIRFEEEVQQAVNQTVDKFGGIDILINNASAISLTPTLQTDMKRYDLMHQINGRGTFLVSQKCLPYLLKSDNAHILTLSPPLNLNPRWFAPHVAYTVAKYNMSMFTLGMAEEFKGKIGINSLWPRTTIATAAVRNILGGEEMVKHSRKPEIMGDAAYYILKRDAKTCTGQFFIDDEVLEYEGITDLKSYAVDPNVQLMPDLYVG